MYRNPYDKTSDHENWHRWNIGEEDGSRGMEPRGVSVAYKDGYNAGKCHLALFTSTNWELPTPRKGRS